MLADEQDLLDAYRSGLDIHTKNAASMFKKPMEEVTKAERSAAKSLTFGILYGKGVETMHSDGDFDSVEEAQNALNLFYEAYPKIKSMIDRQHEDLLKYRGVKTYLGDIIPLDFDETDEYSFAEAKRQSVNYLIQHCSSNLAGVSIYRLYERFCELEIYCKPHSFVHDAAEFEFKYSDLPIVLDLFEKEYLKIYSEISNGTPMEIDMEIGISVGQLLHFKKEGDTLHISGEDQGVQEFILRSGFEVISQTEPEEFKLSPRDLYIKSAYNGIYKYLKSSAILKLN